MDATKLKEIVDGRDWDAMVPMRSYPEPGRYVITGIQAGNLRGERGWHTYVGYVVQVRKKAGCYGSDLVLLRHPDGTLTQHHNQSFFYVSPAWLDSVKAQFDEGVTPEEAEDYTQPYTLDAGTYPEIGRVIEAKEDGPHFECGPMVMITTTAADGSKVVEAV